MWDYSLCNLINESDKKLEVLIKSKSSLGNQDYSYYIMIRTVGSSYLRAIILLDNSRLTGRDLWLSSHSAGQILHLGGRNFPK
jgi:hypothetical protein